METGTSAPKEHHESNYVYAYDCHSTFVAHVSGTSRRETFAFETSFLWNNRILTSEIFISEVGRGIMCYTYLWVPISQVRCGQVRRINLSDSGKNKPYKFTMNPRGIK